jgi:hypothetical protein
MTKLITITAFSIQQGRTCILASEVFHPVASILALRLASIMADLAVWLLGGNNVLGGA